MVTFSSTVVWKIPWMEEHGRLQSMGSLRVGHDWATSLSPSLSLPLLFGLVGLYPVPLPAGFSSVSSSCLYCCVWGGLSVFWQFVEFSLLWSVLSGTSLVAQMVKRLFTMRETRVQSLGWENSLEKEMAVLLPWKSHGWRSLVQATIHGVAKSRARLSDLTSLHCIAEGTIFSIL